MRVRAWAFALAAVLVCVPVAASAQEEVGEEPALAGYVGVAGGAAFSLRPVFPGLLPTGDAPFEITLGLTTANTKSGGNSFAQAAGVWPGSAAANLGPLLGTAAGQPVFSQVIPAWPAAVSADQDAGEAVRGTEPGPVLRAVGSEDGSSARAQGAGGGIPGLLTVEAIASTSRSLVEDLKLVSESIVTLKGVSILDGTVTIDVIKSVATATSTGDDATSVGDVRLDGVKVGGVDVTVTGEGVKAAGPLADAVVTTLEGAGVSLELLQGAGRAEGGTADRVSNGLLVSILNPAAAANPQFEGSRFEISLAPTAVGALASPPFTDEFVSDLGLEAGSGFGDLTDAGGALDAGALDAGVDGSFSSLADTVGDVFGDAGPADTAGGVAGENGDNGALAFEPTGRSFEDVGGVPASLVVALVIATVLAARWIRRVVASLAGMEG